ncbi:tetratricopeptide repeat protein [Sorangium sp. So ce1153]|uniref:tetratricopeptide repeat protein n=1 Tax=Sorangium sp. So ce1153 TaxID=3133333 RepID=UPI003F621576
MHCRCLLIGALSLGVLAATPAAAEEKVPTPQAKAAARSFADEGWNLYTAGRYEEALKAFREADAKVHAPTFLLMVARCYVKLGRLLDARAAYQIILDEKLAASAPPAFTEAQVTARKELADLELRIPTVEVAIKGAVQEVREVTLDGLPIPLSTPVQRDPGEHTLVVHVSGRRPLTKRIRLQEEARERVELDQAAVDALPRTGRLEPESGHRSAGPGQVQGGRSTDGTSGTAGWFNPDRRTAVLIGGGAAAGLGLAAGAVCTMLANGRASDAARLKAELVNERDGSASCPGADPARCAQLKDATLAKVELSNAAFWSFVAGGAIGVGTLAYGIVTMRPAAPTPSIRLTPLLDRDTAGLSLAGKF